MYLGVCGVGSFQCYDQTCVPDSRVCDGFVDCSGLFHEDEANECLEKTQYSCADWWAVGLRESGEYLIDLSLNSNCINTFKMKTVKIHTKNPKQLKRDVFWLTLTITFFDLPTAKIHTAEQAVKTHHKNKFQNHSNVTLINDRAKTLNIKQ